MSHYPPPPSFGVPFTTNHFNPSPSITYPLTPHPPYYQMRDSNNQNQGQSAGPASTLYANSYGFNTNKSSSFRPGIPQSSFSGYVQTMNSSFPPPPFPPIPPPSFGVLPQVHSVLQRQESSSAPIQFHANLPLKPPAVSSLRLDPTPENSQIPTATISELEDGELSDGEERGRSKGSSLGNPKDSQVSINGQDETSSRSSSGDRRTIFQAINTIDSGLAEGEGRSPHGFKSRLSPNGFGHKHLSKQNVNGQEPSIFQDHTKSIQSPQDKRTLNTMQQFSASHDSRRTEVVPEGTQLSSLEVTRPVQFPQNSTPQNHQLLSDKAHKENIPTSNSLPQPTAESPNDIRERAKDVLKELYPHEIGFARLVEEGVDPRILHELYAEIGIQIHSSTPATRRTDAQLSTGGKVGNTPNHTHFQQTVSTLSQGQNQGKGHAASNERYTNRSQLFQSPQVSRISLEPLNTKISNQQSSTSKGARGHGDVENKSPSSQADVAATVRSLEAASKPSTTAKASKPPATHLLGKSANAKPGDKTLERKDYIARMLAAKAGKPIPAASIILAADAPAEHPQGGTLEIIKSQEHKTIGTNEDRSPDALSSIPILSEKIVINPQASAQPVRKVEKTKQDDKMKNSVIMQPQVEMSPSLTVKDHVDTEAKKKAQTELARQKIEALKSRDTMQSDNQKSNRAIASTQSQHPSLGQLQPIAPIEGGAVAVQSTHVLQAVPQSSNSVYSISKPPFSIPGLFMAATTQDSVIPSASPTFQVSVASVQTGAKIPSNFEPSDGVSHSELYPPQPSDVTIPTTIPALLKTSSDDARSTTVSVGANEHRKRQKAADFIDSPSVRVKRTLGQVEDNSVIIEISEDEDNQESDEDEVDMDVDMETDVEEGMVQSKPLKDSSGPNNESGKPKGIRDLPPLSDFPCKKKTTVSLAVMTPPAVHTPTKNKEPEDLKLKEKEIELMNRKIAELEQRIKAKQTASRAQTPEKLGLARASSTALEILTETQEPLKSGISIVKSSQEASKTESRILRAVDEASLNVHEVQIAGDLESFQEAKAADEAKAAQEAELIEKAKVVHAAKVAEQERLLAEQEAKFLEQQKIDAEHLRAAEATKNAEEEQRRLRRNEIEFGLPLLDAEVERTKQKLQSLKRQMEDLESEVQKGIEGRRILMEELVGLAPNPISVTLNEEQKHEDKTDNHVLEADGGLHRFPTPGRILDPIQSQSTQEGGHENPNSSPSTLLPSKPATETNGNEPLVNDHQGNNMDIDISRTSTDEGEVTDYSPEHPNNFLGTENSVNKVSFLQPPAIAEYIPIGTTSQVDDDIYEPPATFDSEKSTGGQITETQLPISTIAHNMPLPDVLNHPMAHDLGTNGDSSEGINSQDEGNGSDRSLPLAEASDSDDYEPPEPTSPVEPAGLTSSGKATSHEVILPNPSDEVNDASKNDMLGMPPQIQVREPSTTAAIIDLELQNGIKNYSKSGKGRYTPYESPLKQFKSYRFHPEYLSEVPRGFRSLTYSHGINSDKPLCRYEVAGGICNDGSCEGQHIRSLGLSDNMILVQMGAIPEGLNQKEGDAYATGLRQIIQEIRGRKVTDFNIVASEIAAYRSKFLGETVKVLSL